MALPAAVGAAAKAIPRLIQIKRIVGEVKKRGEKVVTTPEVLLFALPLAGINDILDFFEWTGIWKIVTLVIDIVTAFLLWIWFLVRLGNKPGFKLRILRFIITPIVEFIFAIGMLPCWTILVTWEWLKGRLIK